MILKLNFKDRIKVLATGSIEEYTEKFLAGEDVDDDDDVDYKRAMKYSAVSACVRVRAETFASVPAILYKKTGEEREAKTDLLIYDILHNRPNEEMAPFNFKEALMTSFDLGGNAVCERLVNSKGVLVGLYPYRHENVKIERNKETKKLEYKIRQDTESRTLQRDQVLHIPNLSYDGIVGLSPIEYAASAIKLGLSYERYGVNFYKNGAAPSGVFEHPNGLSEQAYDRLKSELKKNYTGLRNAGTPMILEEGMKWAQMTVNPVDAQLLESKYFQLEDISRIYRVPQHMIGKLDRSTFSNIEHQSLEFVMYTMLPVCKRYEDNINMQLLTPAQRKDGYFIEFKLDGLLRGDQKSRSEAYGMGRQWGWLSVNDIRRLENMKPIGPEGDIYLQPANMVEAGKDNQSSQVYNRLVEDIYNMISERR